MPAPETSLGTAEVVVAGGGLIGAAAALGVALEGRRVLMIAPAPPRPRPGQLGADLRHVAVSPASQSLLQRLGVWEGLPAAAYRRMEVWEERGTRAMVFDAAEVARSELGWMLENAPAVQALWQALGDHPAVTIRHGSVTGVVARPDRVALTVQASGDADPAAEPDRAAPAGAASTVSTRLLLAADGADSRVRGQLGVEIRCADTGHVALATVVRTARPHRNVAYQRFLLEGPLALLPGVHPRQSSVVWSQPPAAAERRRELPEAAFRVELERCLQSCLGAIEAVDSRVTFALRQQLAGSFNPHPRVVLLGDAARVLHPLAGLGGNLGFEDVREILAVLRRVPAGDPGATGLWQAYERQRRTRARLMLQAMDALRRVYARGDPLSQWVRNLGVAGLNAAAPLKRQIMREAMGLGPVARGSEPVPDAHR